MDQSQAPAQANLLPGIRPPVPPVFDNNIAANWKLFKQKWSNYSVLSDLERKPQKFQVALLQSSLGDDGLNIYNGFKFDTAEDQRTIKEILDMFDSYAVGEVNETYERYLFYQRDQKEGETFENFLASIRSLVKTCNFCNNCIDSLLRDRIVLGILDKETRSTLLKKKKLTLEKAMEICKVEENAKRQNKVYLKDDLTQHQPVSAVRSRNTFERKRSGLCKFCGKKHILKKEMCPAWGQICSRCSGRNHFASNCQTKRFNRKSKAVTHVVNEGFDDEDDDSDAQSDDNWIGNVTKTKSNAFIKCKLVVEGKPVVFMVDTGASVNVLPKKLAPRCNRTKTNLHMWNSTKVTPVGCCNAQVLNKKNGKRYNLNFVVVKENYTPLISVKTAQEMNLIDVNRDVMDIVSSIFQVVESNIFREGVYCSE